MENQVFRTQFISKKEQNQITYDSQIFLIGSCFSENIGSKFEYLKFNSTSNPYGILFHPIAIETAIEECINGKVYSEDDLIFHNELWHSFQHHSDFSDPDKNVVLDRINSSIEITQKKLKKATHIIITLGTSWVYTNKETENTVANCHKIPQKEFTKRLLKISEIEHSISKIKKQLLDYNPNAMVVFTVSPVRHLKDGIVENTLSKSHLIAAIHNNLDNATKYFPAYEIMMDDLRDYRFYKEDMLHPNSLAVSYIWDAFEKAWICETTKTIQEAVTNIQRGLAHRPFNPSSEQHKKFKNKLLTKISELKKQYDISFE